MYKRSDILFIGEHVQDREGNLIVTIPGTPLNSDKFALRSILALFDAEITVIGQGRRKTCAAKRLRRVSHKPARV